MDRDSAHHKANRLRHDRKRDATTGSRCETLVVVAQIDSVEQLGSTKRTVMNPFLRLALAISASVLCSAVVNHRSTIHAPLGRRAKWTSPPMFRLPDGLGSRE